MTLIEWLLSCRCFDIQPVTVKIGEETWQGARYKQCDFERVYLIGKLPKCHLSRTGAPKSDAKVCFPFEGKDWYCVGYFQYINPQSAKYHPFGVNWMLAPWNIPGKIDEYEDEPYQRIALEMTIKA